MCLYNTYIYKKELKKLCIGTRRTGGRNFLGRVCVFHKGGGNKKRYRFIDFYRRVSSKGTIHSVYKDSIRSALFGLVVYLNGLCSYILLSHNVLTLSDVYSGEPNSFEQEEDYYFNGSALPFNRINLFSLVSSIELRPYKGVKLCRAAGTFAEVIGYNNNKVSLKLNSGWNLFVNKNCLASLGRMSNPLHYKVDKILKAGKSRALNMRPTVRGVAKNPCDHPHGGGEGKKSPPAAQKSPWGKLTKGTPTKAKKCDYKKGVYLKQ